MKFLVDAQLPRRLANWLNEAGHDTLHTFDLPKKNLTPDIDLVSRAVRDGDVGCNKRSALHRMFGCYTYGAMPVGYCALHGLPDTPSMIVIR